MEKNQAEKVVRPQKERRLQSGSLEVQEQKEWVRKRRWNRESKNLEVKAGKETLNQQFRGGGRDEERKVERRSTATEEGITREVASSSSATAQERTSVEKNQASATGEEAPPKKRWEKTKRYIRGGAGPASAAPPRKGGVSDKEKPKRKGVRKIKVVMLNSQGAPGAWRALESLGQSFEEGHDANEHADGPDNYAEEAADVIMLQETCMKEGEMTAFRQAAKIKGYRMHAVAGGQTLIQGKDEYRHSGGILTLVRIDLPQRFKTKTVKGHAQCVAVEVCGWVLINSYGPPRGITDHAKALQETMVKLKPAHDDKWLWGADHNAEPDDSEPAAIAAGWNGTRLDLPGESQYPNPKRKPTRWDSNRSIDHFYTNSNKRAVETDLWEKEKFSDHKCVRTTLLLDQECNRETTQLKKTAAYTKLDVIDTELWRNTLEEEWVKADHSKLEAMLRTNKLDEEAIEEEFQQFSTDLEEMCTRTLTTLKERIEEFVKEKEKLGKDEMTEEEVTARDDLRLLESKLKKRTPKGGVGETEKKVMPTRHMEAEEQISAKARRRRLARLFQLKRQLKEAESLEELKKATKNALKKGYAE